jgi:hypothetical protein
VLVVVVDLVGEVQEEVVLEDIEIHTQQKHLEVVEVQRQV